MEDNGQTVVEQPKLSPAVDFLAGTFAGIASLLVGYPLDTVKVRMQSAETSKRYAGASVSRVLGTIIRDEGIRGLYKGVISPMSATAFMNGLVFASYGFLMRVQLEHADQVPTLWQIGLAGAGSGIVTSIVTCPSELIKIRQQLIIQRQPSTLHVIRDILRVDGLRGPFRGWGVTAARDLGYGSYFLVYEGMCRALHPSNGNRKAERTNHASLAEEAEHEITTLSIPRLLLAGGLAGVAGWTSTFAFDVVKTRVQGAQGRFRDIWEVSREAYRSGGTRVFFTGLWPTIVRAVPVNMVTFGAFELGVKVLSSV